MITVASGGQRYLKGTEGKRFGREQFFIQLSVEGVGLGQYLLAHLHLIPL